MVIKKKEFRIFKFSVGLLGLLVIILWIAVFELGCKEPATGKRMQGPGPEAFNQYWFQGLAEISRFELDQARYNEIHKGEAVLIFVTEQFFAGRQVKSELGQQPGAVPILKLNLTRDFNTGIYSYSMMTSVFTPVDRKDFPQTLKTTTSAQEWCGQTFTQFNLRKDQYHVLLRSYFMDEGDREYKMSQAQLEDEIWTAIRFGPQTLTTGDIELIPGSQFSRLKHVQQKVEHATASLDKGDDRYSYSIQYKALPRKLKIEFRKEFPYDILAWEETTGDKDKGQKLLITRAVRTHMTRVDYWNKNAVADLKYRKTLGLN